MSTATFPLLRVFTPYSTLMHYKGYFVGACPICNGTPAKMVVRPEQGAWHCYSCGAGGDPVDFLQSVEQLSRDQAYLLYKVLIRDETATLQVAAPAEQKVAAVPAAAAVSVAEPRATPPAAPMEEPELPVPPTAIDAPKPAAEPGSLVDLRQRLASVEGFRGVACFGTNGKALLLEGMNGEELTAINAYFDSAFRAAQGLLGAPAEPTMEGVLQDQERKFIRLDAPVAGSRCRVFLALAAGASEARFRMVVRGFLDGAKLPLQ